jgi:ATP synthase protein I
LARDICALQQIDHLSRGQLNFARPARQVFPAFFREVTQVWKQFRTAIASQLAFTTIATLAAAWLGGIHGALSAALGGSIGIAGSGVFAALAVRSKANSAGDVLASALKAEAAKLFVAVLLVVVAMKSYREAVPLALFATWMVSLLIFGMAFFYRNAALKG